MMKKILMIDDNKMLITLLAKKISNSLGFAVDTAFSFADARALLDEGNEYFVCFAELNLADSPNGEILDFLLQKSLRVAVLTANNDKALKEACLKKDILAYLYKESDSCLEQMRALMTLLDKHQNEKIILAMSKLPERNELKKALRLRLFNVLACAHGEEALNYLNDNDDTKLIICDAQMPVIDGATLINEVKERYPKADIGFIILGEKDESVEAEFLNENVGEFITKPFGKELFNARLDKYLKARDTLGLLKIFVDLDPQTGAKKANAFKNEVEDYLRDIEKTDEEFTFGVVQIDDLQGINDEYGANVSQMMMKSAANEAIKAIMGKDIVGLIGTDKLGILLKDTKSEWGGKIFANIRAQIKNKSVFVSLDELYFSVCIGLTYGKAGANFNELLNKADNALKIAQGNGKDRVEVCF